ncbi:ATP-binding protein [Natrialba swarupiae]|uniref:histidine kinase n=1 Tax=Natrialba swarupiae TaxID=2448032 RepID=A0A5D5AQB6_9EURY|nr:ATP-binding protein [Natrialba swarupiae]TYT63177.1 PAS domain S-box protein [Natrialba swarupiae]
MDHDDLVSTFGETVGVEKAQSLLEDTLDDLGLEQAKSYSSHEVADICETIARDTDGYLEIVATEIRVRERAQRRFDALIEELSDPVVAVSFHQSTPIVTGYNPAFEATFGYGQDAVGRSLPALIVPADDRTDPLDVWFRSDDGRGTELDRLTDDGERRTFLFQPVVVSGFGGEIEGYGIYTDITDEKRRERTLERQNEQLERFVSVVSHDLRNPLTVAQGNVDLARQLNDDPEVATRLEDAIDAQERMEQLVEDLLALASQGRTVDDPRSVVLEDVVSNAWRYVETADVELVETFPDGLTIEADGDRLSQLFENLFRNAVEHGSTSPQSQTPEDAVEHGSTSPRSQTPEDAVEHGSTSPRSQTPEDAVEHGSTSPQSQTPEDAVEHGSTSPRSQTPEDAVEHGSTSPRSQTPEDAVEHGSTSPRSQTPEDAVEHGSTSHAGADGSADAVEHVAGDSTDESGERTVHVGWDEGVLFVEDDGPGIPADERENVFDHGYTTSADGTGFGLAIVEAIADAHGWAIDVGEGIDGGARFEIRGISVGSRP